MLYTESLKKEYKIIETLLEARVKALEGDEKKCFLKFL